MNKKFLNDYRRYGLSKNLFRIIKNILTIPEISFLYFYRSNSVLSKILKKRIMKKYTLEIYSKNIGEGFFINHPYGITVNPNTVIGKNCNIHKGVTIGQENRGKRKGTPTIGNEVWIGTNSVIVGNIKIGNDVLIAPLTYINFDVPDHSIVIGNPGKIIHKDHATEEYINRKV